MKTPTLPEHRDASYWVGSVSEFPLRIMFTHEDARVSGYHYLDAFNGDGELLQAYMMVGDNYTTDF